MPTGPRHILLPLACAALFGCTTSDGEDAGALAGARGQAGSLALVQVERFSDGEDAPLRIVTRGKVARYRAIDGDSLLRLLGADARDLDTCGVVAGFGELSLAPEAHVELLSIGDLSLRSGDTQSSLAPRLFPALATTASGWFYAGEAESSAPRTGLEDYTLSARGEQGVGAFELTIGSPAEVAGLALSGVPADHGAKLDRTHDAEITWDAEDPGTRIELEVYAGGSVLSCAAQDDGRFTLSVGRLAGIEADENATLVVRRVRVSPLEMQGIDSAYARIASTRSYALQVR